MRTVYAIQLRLPLRENQTPLGVIEDVRARITQWIVDKYSQAWTTTITLPFDGSTATPRDAHMLRSRHQSIGDVDLLSVEWAHPHDRDPSSVWHTAIVAGRNGQDVEIAVVVRIATVQMTLRPVGYELGRPRIVTGLLDDYAARMNDSPVPISQEMLKASDVGQYVEDVLLAPNRSLPVVVVTRDAWTDRVQIDPTATFEAIRGFAHVAVTDSKWAAFKLTDILGKELSCYNGAVRIYWPGFNLDTNPFEHRLYLPGNLAYWQEKGVPFGKHLLRMFAAISAFRFAEGPVIGAARKALADAERTARIQVADEVKQAKKTRDELESQLLEAFGTISDLEKERDQLKGDLEAQKAAWGDYQSFMTADAQSDGAQEAITAAGAREGAFESVEAAYASAKGKFAGPLVFLESADRSAAESPYKNPDRVYELLEALALVADEWRDLGGTLGRSWEKALQELGFEYKDKVSQTSRTRFGTGYTFTYKGERLVFAQHITLGAKQADKCLSVHFYRDDADRVLVIGHCGRHLRNTKS